MYRLEWIEARKQRQKKTGILAPEEPAVHPIVWKLGFTSLLTDISSEMVHSLLPVYLVLHLHMSPLQFGTIDGIYSGMAMALLALAGGFLADRTRRPREVAALGYGVSAACKLLFLFAGASWAWIAGVVALDRTGKGFRTAPRDAMISLCNRSDSLATAFSVHRALDAGGALFGPIVAFILLSERPGKFDAIWLTSFVFAFLGLAVLWLFVENPPAPKTAPLKISWRVIVSQSGRQFWILTLFGALLSVITLSDGFLYLLLQKRTGLAVGFFPLFYIATACVYMVLSIPCGKIADRAGRKFVFFSGYIVLAAIYLLLLFSQGASLLWCGGCLFLFGLYYAATEGVLTAMISAVIPAELRTSGLALLGTFVSLGKLISSLLFGWLWQTWDTQSAISTLAIGLVVAVAIGIGSLRQFHDEKMPSLSS
jgi:predicted MFS family arabinose efflux permease